MGPGDILRRVADAPTGLPRPVVVLDLDSTLIDTGPRHVAILRAFVDSHYARERDIVDEIAREPVGWSVETALRDRGWPDDRLASFRAFWAERFFDGAWCSHDRAVPGATTFARRILEAGGIAYYLTARPAPTMGEGTVRSLSSLGFPVLRGRCPLHLKPTVHLSDHQFKRAALQEVAELGHVVATFENEPAHAHALQGAFPRAEHFLVGDVRSPDAPPPHPGLHPIRDFHLS